MIDKHILDYVDEKQSVYEKKFAKIDEGKISWNWCAFLVPGAWFLYRKMYKYFVVLFCIGLVTGSLEFLVSGHASEIISYITSIAISVCGGLFGDKLYYSRIKKLVAADDASAASEEQRTESVQKYGGVSPAAVVVLIMVAILSFAIVTYSPFPL